MRRLVVTLVAAVVALFAYAAMSRTSTAHRLTRSCGELRWDAPQRPTWLVVHPSAQASAQVLAVAATLWNDASRSDDLRVDTSSTSVTAFADAIDGLARGEHPGPVGGVLVVSGDAAGLASPATDGADDGEIAARLWWGPNCGLAFGVLRVPDLSGMPLWVSVPAALHAVGHALGLAHSDDPTSVMAAAALLPNPIAMCPERQEDPEAICVEQAITVDDADIVRAERW